MRARRAWMAATVLGILLAAARAEAFRYVEVGQPVPSVAQRDLEGRAVTVPRPGRPAAIVFVRPGQSLSERVLEDVAALATGGTAVDFLVIIEAGGDLESIRALVRGPGLAATLDRDGRAAQAWGVIVHPSTAVVGPDGRLRYYLPSRSRSYRALVESHLLRAVGAITDGELAARLARSGDNRASAAEGAQGAYRRGVALEQEQRWDEAAAALGRALESAPDLLDARLHLGYVRLEQGRPAEALREFESVLAGQPGSPGARVGVGIARIRLGDAEQGIRLLTEAVKLNPEPVRGHYELGRAHEARGDPARAVEHYRWAYLKLLQGRK